MFKIFYDVTLSSIELKPTVPFVYKQILINIKLKILETGQKPSWLGDVPPKK
jgi:hypothetical protein